MYVNTCADSDRSLVSVIIPAFNAATVIERTVRSVIAQSCAVLEILVVDDGSTDETGSVVKRLSADDSRISLLQQENRGVSAARNLGIKHARGEYIALLDADDIWFPEKIAKQVEVFRTSPDSVGLVYTQSVRIFEDGRPAVYSPGAEEEGTVFFPLLLGNFLQNSSTPMIRRGCFDRVGMYSLEYRELNAQGCEDWDIYLRVAEHYEFRVVNEYLTGYWQSADSMSADWKLMDRSYRMLMAGVRKRHAEIPGYIFRWSRSNYLLYLANRATRAGETASSMQLLARAAALDPFVLANRRLQRLVGKNLRRPGRGRKLTKTGTDSQHPVPDENGRGARSTAGGAAWRYRLKQRRRHLDKLQQQSRQVGDT